MSYRPISLPPDTTQTVYVCSECAAIVTDPTVHSESHVAEPRRRPRITNTPVAPVGNVEYESAPS